MKRVASPCGFLLFFSAVLLAQFGSGIQGTIVDPSSALVAGVLVRVTNLDTGVTREAVTSDAGIYRIPGLNPGPYKVTASKSGFTTAQEEKVELAVNEVRRVDFTLSVGNVVETVSVSAQATVLETEEGRISGRITTSELKELPIPNRNVFNLLSVQPGVTGRSLGADNVGGSSTPSINANGNRVDSNSFTVDGMNANSISRGGRSEVTPNLETVAEVRVVTNNFSAEEGRNMGAHVSVTTKSGTNEFHGGLWDFHRNNRLESRNAFNLSSVPVSRRNQFGFGFGGPIIRNRTFFYTSYEGLRSSGSSLNNATVETPQLRNWVLANRPNSIAAYVFGKHKPVGDPTQNIRDVGTPQAGVNRFSSTPDGIPDIGTVQYLTSSLDTSDQFTLRVDHELRPGKDRLYAYWYTHEGYSQALPVRPEFNRNNPTEGNFGNLNWTHIFSARTLNEAKAGVTRWLGNYDDLPHKEVPEITITGLGTIRDANVYPGGWFPTEYQFGDTLSHQRGTHGLKFGGQIRRAINILWHTRSYVPRYSFASVLDFVDDEALEMQRTVDPRNGQPISTRADQRIWEGALFFQDDWKVRRGFTVNFGVRWEYFGPYTDAHGRLRDFVFGQGSNYAQRVATGKVDVVDASWKRDNSNIAPRFGFAWDIGGKAKNVLRGGYGISYDRMATVYTAGYRENPPLAAQAVLGQNFGTSFTYSLGDPSKPYLGYPVDAALQVGLDERNGIRGARVALRAIDDNFNNPYAHNWFFGIQRLLPGQLVAELSYIGSSGHHLVNITNVNRFNGDLLDGRLDGFNPSFSQINMAQTTSNSIYHGGTLMVRRQFARGFSFQGSYTIGKVITDAEAEQDVTNYYDAFNRGIDRSVASFDVPQRVAAVGIWEIPFLRTCNSIACKLLGGWQLSGYTVLEKGRPLTVTTGATYPRGDFNADGINSDRPNAPLTDIKRDGFSRDEYINGIFRVSDFPLPPSGTVGNLGRNTFRGPGFARIDMSLLKGFRIKERFTGSLRLDSFNSLNRVNLNNPNTDLNNNNFGRVTGAADARNYQVSLQFRF
jgi:hypothetical protein